MTESVVKRHVYVPAHSADVRPGGGPDTCAECSAPAQAEQHMRTVELSEAGKAWRAELAAVDDQLAAIKSALLDPLAERREAAVRNLQAECGDAEAITIDGRPVATWAWSKPGDGVDLAALKRDHPDIYAAYYKPKTAARPFKPVTA